MILRSAGFALLLLSLACPLTAEDPDAFIDSEGSSPAAAAELSPSARAAVATAPLPGPKPEWISVVFGAPNACNSAPLTLAFKAPREGKWQKLELVPRCSVEWWRPSGPGELLREPKSVDATSYEAAWLPGGKALLLLQWSQSDEERLLLDARILRANGQDRRVKPAIGDGSFYLSPDRSQLWYTTTGDGISPGNELSLYRLDLDDELAAFSDPETMAEEAFGAMGALQLERIKP